nr:PREDICTED: uncharacterized protein LOC105352332 isoform X2 [Fragaria vesca subsp. vesca]
MATGEVLFPADPTSHPRTHLQNIYRRLGTPSENPYPSDVKDQWDTQKTIRPTLNLYARLLPLFGQSGSELVNGIVVL